LKVLKDIMLVASAAGVLVQRRATATVEPLMVAKDPVEESTKSMAAEVVAAVVPDQDQDPIKDMEAMDGAEEDPYRLDVQEEPEDVACCLARIKRNADINNIVPTVVPMITMGLHVNFIRHIANKLDAVAATGRPRRGTYAQAVR
jgi:hypothetical protein